MVDDYKINLIKEKTDIVDFIGHYVRLTKKGQNYLGLCPFHQEKTPSFTVSPGKNIWHCFGCSEGGNIYSFLMKIENIGFGDAVKSLAEKAGVELSENEVQQSVSKKDSLADTKTYNVLNEAKDIYRSNISELKAKDYLKHRGLSQETVDAFEIGYAKPSGTDLWKILSQKYTSDELLESGLFVETGSGFIDRFKDRLIFPIVDLQNRVIAFGGRTLSDDVAKYINSPETKVYHKSNHLYGLNMTKKYIRENDDCLILVEGYMDAVALYQAGIRNVAAVLGTSFTSPQAKLLSRFASKCKLCFDSDDAGKKATIRARDVFVDKGFEVQVINLKECKDPDDYIRKYGKESFVEQISNADMLLKFIINRLVEQYKPIEKATEIAVEDKDRIIKEVHSLLAETNAIVVNEYVGYLSNLLKIDHDLIKSRLFPYQIFNMRQKRYTYKGSKADKYTIMEKETLSILINDINLRSEYLSSFSKEDFNNKDSKDIFELLEQHPLKTVHDFMLLDQPEIMKKMVELSMLDYIDDNKKFLEEAKLSFKKKSVDQQLNFLDSEIKRLEKTGDSDKLNLLLNEFIKLKKNQ